MPSTGAFEPYDPHRLPDRARRWAAAAAGADTLTVVRGLRDGGGPWLVEAAGRRLVLRAGHPEGAGPIAAEATGLRQAAAAGIPAPVLVAYDDGTAAGLPSVLFTFLPGSSAIPRQARPARLRALGAVTARLHAVPPPAGLDRREWPIGDCDFPALRAGHDLGPLQRAAQAAKDAARPADGPDVLVHGDLWQGNALFDGDTLTALLDWDCTGVGAPGIDLGALRLDAAFCFGVDAARHVLAGYEAAAGAPAADVAYWDLVAGLATPPELGWFPDAISGQGRPDLTRELLLERHAAFLGQALDRL
jgi:aminoglycoside phosphotransferase (APT) family kinase protein